MSGLIPARGNWVYRTLDVSSTATFRKGSAVALTPTRVVDEYASTDSAMLGIAMHNSVNSLPAGKVVVAIPNGADCTFSARIATNLARSELSIGTPVGITKSGNTVDLLVEAPQASAFSRVGMIYGEPILSPVSRIEVACTNTAGIFFSSSTVTVAS